MKLEVSDVSYSVGRFRLSNLSFHINEGQINGIGGKNGSGKSTLFNLLYGYRKPESGRIMLDGRDINTYTEQELSRKIAIVRQETPEPINFSTRDVISVFGFSNGYGNREIENVLELCKMAHLEHRDFNSLSGGEKRLVMIAGALFQDSEMILMDEPTTFLDVDKEAFVHSLIRDLKSRGKTVVVILHDVNLLYRLCDNVVFLKDGKVVAEGTPESVFLPLTLKEIFGVDFISYDSPEGKRFVTSATVADSNVHAASTVKRAAE